MRFASLSSVRCPRPSRWTSLDRSSGGSPHCPCVCPCKQTVAPGIARLLWNDNSCCGLFLRLRCCELQPGVDSIHPSRRRGFRGGARANCAVCAARRVPASAHVLSGRLSSVVLPESRLIEDVAPTTEPCFSAESRQQGGSQQSFVLSGVRRTGTVALVFGRISPSNFSREPSKPSALSSQVG